jgi:hypothetical protein
MTGGADERGGSRIKSGMTKERKQPRWVIPFLRALERTGEVRAAAEDAGVDHSTAYARRRTHAEFAERWDAALRAHEARKAREEAGAIEALNKAPPSPAFAGATSAANAGEDDVVSGGKVRRAGTGRWSKAKEAIFFEELAATANATLAAKAAGVSANAVFARRLKHPLFRAKWEAVLKTARASIQMHLVEEAKRTFDPEALETGEVAPRVTIDQAIKISQLHASKTKAEEALPDPFAEEAAAMSPEDVQALREKIIRKLRRMRERDMPDMIAEGWSYDEERDHMVPPGWTRN